VLDGREEDLLKSLELFPIATVKDPPNEMDLLNLEKRLLFLVAEGFAQR